MMHEGQLLRTPMMSEEKLKEVIRMYARFNHERASVNERVTIYNMLRDEYHVELEDPRLHKHG